MLSPRRRPDTATASFGVAAALAAAVCCVGLPAIGGAIGGLALGAVLGLGVAAIALGAIGWAAVTTVTRRRHRVRCDRRIDDRDD